MSVACLVPDIPSVQRFAFYINTRVQMSQKVGDAWRGMAWPNLRRGAVHDPALGFPVWEGHGSRRIEFVREITSCVGVSRVELA